MSLNMNIKTKTFALGDDTITLETGRIARQAHGAVFATMGNTQVLATVVAKKEAKEGQSFFPLSVDYIEKIYAAGKIPGGFLKREGRPSEKEVLTSRLIDRPIRPLFPEGFMNEVQVLIYVVSSDNNVDPDILAMIAASCALSISGAPFNGPIGGVRVGYENDKYVLNPHYSSLKNSKLDMVVAGTKSAVLMVESKAQQLKEEIMLDAVNFAHQAIQIITKNITEFTVDVANPKWQWRAQDINEELLASIKDNFGDAIQNAYKITNKQDRYTKISDIKDKLINQFSDNENIDNDELLSYFKKIEKSIVRDKILAGQPRIDGRDATTVRDLKIETGVLKSAHGSALFTRGETQALVVATLGSKRDAQLIEILSAKDRIEDYFMLHYNFPPFCVGEVGRTGSIKRREIGHGRLARKSIEACLPSIEEYPYSMRIVSEITESNGSSSMASVCGSSLALFDAGVPIKTPVAGIAMGLVKKDDKFVVLTDILGDEDHLGDMDFKVAGTNEGINALQMDIKIEGITIDIMQIALKQARDARIHILQEMNKIIASPNTNNANTPKTSIIKINTTKIRDLIGKGGEVIKNINATSGASVDVDDDGNVSIFSNTQQGYDAALKMVKDVTAEAEVNKVYTGKVSKIVEFGAFITILPNQDGLLHISEIAHERVAKVDDYLTEGDEIDVKVLSVERGRIKLSRKILLDK